MTGTRLSQELADISEHQARVVTLKQLGESNISRGQRRANVSAERWADLPQRGVITDLGPVEGSSAWWRAVTVLGPHARLGGVTALEAAGLTGYVEPLTHVWLPKSSYKGQLDGVRLHEPVGGTAQTRRQPAYRERVRRSRRCRRRSGPGRRARRFSAW